MEFLPQEQISPISVSNIVVILKDGFDEENGHTQSANFELKIVMSDGTIKRRAGNLTPYITAIQQQALINFMSALRLQAESEILP